MKKNKIISLLKEKNNNEVDFTYDFNVIANELGIEYKKPYKKASAKLSYHNYAFKFVTIGLFLIAITLFIVLISGLHKGYNSSEPKDILTNEDIIHKYYIDNDINYIKSPITTEIVGEEVVKIYLGLNKESKVVFVYSADLSRKDINIEVSVYSMDGDNKVDIIETNLGPNDKFVSTTSNLANKYYFDLNTNKLINQGHVNETISIEVTEYLSFLNKQQK